MHPSIFITGLQTAFLKDTTSRYSKHPPRRNSPETLHQTDSQWKGALQPHPEVLPRPHSPQRLDKVKVGELVQPHKRVENLDIELISAKKNR